MAAAIIYEGVPSASASPADALFAGQKFWFSLNVPQRRWLIENAAANGAEIVSLEKQADILLVDHARKNVAPGTHSYRYVELSIRNGVLEDLADHAVGVASRSNRTVGSVTTAAKIGRNAFTEEEDQLLWDWVWPYVQMGEKSAGNVIYQQLEAYNPRHTFQSWRDRWLKKVQFQKREVSRKNIRGEMVVDELPATQGSRGIQKRTHPAPASRRVEGKGSSVERATPTTKRKTRVVGEMQEETATKSTETTPNGTPSRKRGRMPKTSPHNPAALNVPQKTVSTSQEVGRRVKRSLSPMISKQIAPGKNRNFTRFDAVILLRAAAQILDSDQETLMQGWQAMTEAYPLHTAKEWKNYFEAEIAPAYKRRIAKKGTDKWDSEDDQDSVINGELDELLREEEEPVARQSTRVDRGSSPIKELEYRSSRRERSPSFQPATPTVIRAPASNQGRKRSPGRTTNPNFKKPTLVASIHSRDLDGTSEDEFEGDIPHDSPIPNKGQPLSPSKRKRSQDDDGSHSNHDIPSLEDVMGQRQKRVKRLQSQAEKEQDQMEIPSTPPSAAKRLSSPLFVPQDDPEQVQEEAENTRKSPGPETIEDQDSFIAIIREVGKEKRLVTSQVVEPELPSNSQLVQQVEIKSTKKRKHNILPWVPPTQIEDKASQSQGLRSRLAKDANPANEETEEVESRPQRGRARSTSSEQHGITSPLNIRLFSDHDEAPQSSSFSQPEAQLGRESDEEDDEAEKTPEFEMAPEMSVIWETAPEEVQADKVGDGEIVEDEDPDDEEVEGDDDDDEETITIKKTTKENGRLETQILFEQQDLGGESGDEDMDAALFALPEPEGGWGDIDKEEIWAEAEAAEENETQEKEVKEEETEEDGRLDMEIPETYQEQQSGTGTGDADGGASSHHTQAARDLRSQTLQASTSQSQTPDAEDAETNLSVPSSPSIDVNDYVNDLLASHPDMDEELLLMAVDATCMDPDLVPAVYESLSAWEEVPSDIAGVWTEQDDEVLAGGDVVDGGDDWMAELLKKHGIRGVGKRREWLSGEGE